MNGRELDFDEAQTVTRDDLVTLLNEDLAREYRKHDSAVRQHGPTQSLT